MYTGCSLDIGYTCIDTSIQEENGPGVAVTYKYISTFYIHFKVEVKVEVNVGRKRKVEKRDGNGERSA